jgi:transaldolase
LKALAEETKVGSMMAADGGKCEQVLAEFADAGIDIDALAEQLQDEGTKSFVKSWESLMTVIASKRDLVVKASAVPPNSKIF